MNERADLTRLSLPMFDPTYRCADAPRFQASRRHFDGVRSFRRSA
jgi:hypothetical protein